MSSKNSILLTITNEHWYYDCSDISPNGNDNVFLEFGPHGNTIETINDSYKITLSKVLAKMVGLKEIAIPSNSVLGWSYDYFDGFIFRINGDSDFVHFLKQLKIKQ